MKKRLAFLLSVFMLLSILSFGFSVAADDTAVITVGNNIATPGSVVSVNISITNNPGILAMAFCLEYDSDAFEYIDYTQGYLTDYTVTNHADKGIVSFVSVEDRNISKNGTILTFNFNVKANAENADYTFEIKNNNPDKYGNSLHNSFANASEQFVNVNAVAGTVTVDGDYVAIKGDVNSDGNVNNRDLAVLMQYINDWNVEVNLYASDVISDGNINNRDYALIMQYINGWDVELNG